jgi:hypothetical protein
MVLATNLPKEETYSPDYILQSYKEQQACERGFRFLKDPLFFASRVFLKLPRRVMTLSFLMMLCLVVYSLGQRQLPFGRLRDHVRLLKTAKGLFLTRKANLPVDPLYVGFFSVFSLSILFG